MVIKEEEEKIEREEDTAGNNYIPNTELNTSHALFNFFLLILRWERLSNHFLFRVEETEVPKIKYVA